MKKILSILILLASVVTLTAQTTYYMHRGRPVKGNGSFAIAESGVSVDSANWEEQTKAWYYEMINPPSLDSMDILNTFVRTMVDSGYWARADVGYWLAVKDETDALINIIDPTAGTYDLVEGGAGSLTFLPYEGFTGDNVNYFNTSWNPSTDASNYALNSASLLIYIGNDTESATSVMGMDESNDAYINPTNSSNTYFARVNTTTSMSSARSYYSTGLWAATRTASNATAFYWNEEPLFEASFESTAIPNADLYLHSRNGTTMSGYQIRLAFVFDGLSSSEIIEVGKIIRQALKDLGGVAGFERGGNEIGYLSALDNDTTALWYFADNDYMHYSDSDTLNYWFDISGNEQFLWQPSLGNQYLPTFGGDSVNFRTGSVQLEDLSLDIPQPFTMYAVIKLRSYVSTGYQGIFDFGDLEFTTTADNTTTIDWFVNDVTAGSLSASTTNEIPVGEYCVITVTIDGASSSIRINDNVADAGGTIDADTRASRLIMSHNGMDFAIKEFIVRTKTEETNITSSLMTKYEIE